MTAENEMNNLSGQSEMIICRLAAARLKTVSRRSCYTFDHNVTLFPVVSRRQLSSRQITLSTGATRAVTSLSRGR